MGKRTALLTGIAVAALSAGASYAANIIPYPTPGTPITLETYGFTALSNEEVKAYFWGANASDGDDVTMTVNGVPTGVFGLPNHTSSPGDEFDMGMVHKGDTIVFALRDATEGDLLYSVASMNADGFNHAYATPYDGTGGPAGIPAGTFVGFEDRLASQGSDFDYNDDQFVFTNVSSSIPEASTWAMTLAGFGLLGYAAMRRSHKATVSVA